MICLVKKKSGQGLCAWKRSIEDLTGSMTNCFESSYQTQSAMPMSSCRFLGTGSIPFVLTALIRGLFALNSVSGLTIGDLMAFLQLNRSFTGPLPRSLNNWTLSSHGLGWWNRVFDLLRWRKGKRERRVDQGKVTLVNYELASRWRNSRNWSENQQMGLEHHVKQEITSLSKMVGNGLWWCWFLLWWEETVLPWSTCTRG